LSTNFRARLSAAFQFEAAHKGVGFPEGHPNTRIHGHSYSGEIIVEGPVDPESGCVMDHAELEAVVKEVVGQLDHQFLNDVPGLEVPSSEHIARWIWQRMKKRVPLSEVIVRRPTVGITVSYSGLTPGGNA
jgi:6-pyruvoyltetrahydropterin/6-carboxytetrahydropterin synthase